MIERYACVDDNAQGSCKPTQLHFLKEDLERTRVSLLPVGPISLLDVLFRGLGPFEMKWNYSSRATPRGLWRQQ